MVPEIIKLEITEEQKKLIEELRNKNESSVTQLNKILGIYKEELKIFEKGEESFWKVMKILENSNSHYPFGHFTDFYYNNLEPSKEAFINEFGDKSQNFDCLSKDEKEKIESQFPNYKEYFGVISKTTDSVSLILTESLIENMFIKKISGLPEKYVELEESNKNWIYPRGNLEKKYGIKGSFIGYDANLPILLPYHRQKMITYGSLFNTAVLIKQKIENIILILRSINAYLPFAELIPAIKMPQMIINVEANANNDSTSVGNSNKFEGDTTVGGGEIVK